MKYKSPAVAGKPRDGTVNFDQFRVCRPLFFFDTFRGVDMVNA